MEDGYGPGLFLLGWGLLASGTGLLLATDFRGTAGRFLDFQERTGRRTPSPLGPPRKARIKRLRLIGAAFSVAGPPVFVFALLNLAEHGIGAGATAPLHVPWPVAGVGCLVAAYITWSLWRPAGQSRRMWTGGGWVCRTALVLHTAAVPAFAASPSYGNLAILQSIFLIGALAQITVMTSAPGATEAPDTPTAPAAP
ncbi:hypothetical protein [Streptomyces sp. NBC_00503]|uniref:hypothetical protein n=1 Tax=Streptomyces sp. NBC_00503 TaxID=2903659 RepID=UPI002E80B63C|nr:hypothetical protein [Streptomyces sp. NBC_00503]WUD82070.1 hypothetical protein OG490_16810 [Streptomyces sp. NBC_00503]